MRGGETVGARRPKAKRAGLAWIIRRRTLGGEELIQFMLDVLRREGEFKNRVVPVKLRMEAAAWLADHGWGKPEGLTRLLAQDEAADHGVIFVPIVPREPEQLGSSEPEKTVIEGEVVERPDGRGDR